MGRLALTATLLWIFLVPTLCLAGVFDHTCGDCVFESCSHEEDCSDDPCATILSSLQPTPRAAGITFAFLATGWRVLELCPAPSPEDLPGVVASRPPVAAFPLHKSDRPLRN